MAAESGVTGDAGLVMSIQYPPLNSSTLLDNDAIDAMKVAVDITPSIWGSMEGLVHDTVSAKFDVSKALINVKAVTKRLSDGIKAVRELDLTADAMTPLRSLRYVYVFQYRSGND